MLKGWLERVWLPGVTFGLTGGRFGLPKSKLQNIRLFIGITTSGSPWWWIRLIRDPGRNLWTRGLRVLFNRRCKVIWHQLYSIDRSTDADRARFLSRLDASLRNL